MGSNHCKTNRRIVLEKMYHVYWTTGKICVIARFWFYVSALLVKLRTVQHFIGLTVWVFSRLQLIYIQFLLSDTIFIAKYMTNYFNIFFLKCRYNCFTFHFWFHFLELAMSLSLLLLVILKLLVVATRLSFLWCSIIIKSLDRGIDVIFNADDLSSVFPNVSINLFILGNDNDTNG